MPGGQPSHRKGLPAAACEAAGTCDATDRMRADVYSRLLALWAMQEQLLHVYHAIFLAANAALFGIYAVLRTADAGAPENTASGGMLLYRAASTGVGVLGVVLCILWLLMFLDRSRAADYFPSVLKRLDADPSCVVGYVKTYSEYEAYRKAGGSLWRRSRAPVKTSPRDQKPARLLLALLPVCFLVVWLCICAYTLTVRTAGDDPRDEVVGFGRRDRVGLPAAFTGLSPRVISVNETWPSCTG